MKGKNTRNKITCYDENGNVLPSVLHFNMEGYEGYVPYSIAKKKKVDKINIINKKEKKERKGIKQTDVCFIYCAI